MNKRYQTLKYLTSDFIAALLAWTSFFIYRKVFISQYDSIVSLLLDKNYFISIPLIPFFWITLYYIQGYYSEAYRKSRFNELGQTVIITIVGTTILFFVAILDDTIDSYKNYYSYFITLFSLHFVLTYIPRLIITSITVSKIQRGIISFNSIIIGANGVASDIYNDITTQRKKTGNKIIGFINIHEKPDFPLSKHIMHLGGIDNLNTVIQQNNIEEVIIAIESSEHEEIGRIMSLLDIFNVKIKVAPDMYDILMGSVRVNSIHGTPLIEISSTLMPEWQKSIKQLMDITIAALALIICIPICVFLMLAIKMSSKGAIFYSHYRVGRYGKEFKIYKFRSMYSDAEKNGPELASKYDMRVTPVGRIMRKLRLDEIPNFVNVLIGDMSIVGPRPERKHFIEQIIQKAPQYLHLHKVKPGITSLGQVKFGYAENVDQMIKRLRYDLIYIENMSIFMDIKIIVYTILIIIRGHGI